jgi:hypothetical protein
MALDFGLNLVCGRAKGILAVRCALGGVSVGLGACARD